MRAFVVDTPAAGAGAAARVDGAFAAGVTPGAATWTSALAAWFTELQRLPWMQGEVVVALEGSLALTKVFGLPPSSRTQRARLVAFEAQQRLPFSLADVRWTHAVPHGHHVWVAAARREVIEGIEQAAQTAGLVVAAIAPMAMHLARVAAQRASDASAPAWVLAEMAGSWECLLLDGPHTVARTVTPPVASSGGPAEDEPAWLRAELARTLAHQRRNGGAAPTTFLLASDRPDRAPFLRRCRHDLEGATQRATAPSELTLELEPGDESHDLLRHSLRVTRAVRRRVPVLNLLSGRSRRDLVLQRVAPSLAGVLVLLGIALAFPLLRHAEQLADIRQRIEQRHREDRRAQLLADAYRQHRDAAVAARATADLWRRVHAVQETWPRLLHHLDQSTATVPGLWLERVAWDPAAPTTASSATSAEPRVQLATGRLIISGALFDGSLRRTPVSDAMFETVRRWLAGLATAPGVEAIEHERFAPSAPGLLRFDAILLLQAPALIPGDAS